MGGPACFVLTKCMRKMRGTVKPPITDALANDVPATCGDDHSSDLTSENRSIGFDRSLPVANGVAESLRSVLAALGVLAVAPLAANPREHVTLEVARRAAHAMPGRPAAAVAPALDRARAQAEIVGHLLLSPEHVVITLRHPVPPAFALVTGGFSGVYGATVTLSGA